MRSGQWTWRPPPAPAIADCTEPAEVPRVKPVWVLLEKLYRPTPRATKTVIDGLDLTGRAPGMLIGDWLRSSRGDYLAQVHISIRSADPTQQTRQLFRAQLVPAYALQPRHDGRFPVTHRLAGAVANTLEASICLCLGFPPVLANRQESTAPARASCTDGASSSPVSSSTSHAQRREWRRQEQCARAHRPVTTSHVARQRCPSIVRRCTHPHRSLFAGLPRHLWTTAKGPTDATLPECAGI
jgi:hypothetical protein